VAVVQRYWQGILRADGVTSNSNQAARACLGAASPGDAPDANFVDADGCRAHAVALVAVQQRFLDDVSTTVAPKKFAADDAIFRSEVPRAIAGLQAMISAASTGNRQSVVDATIAYIDVMVPKVTGALDHVDPSVRHQ
jgi:hypothetical protein